MGKSGVHQQTREKREEGGKRGRKESKKKGGGRGEKKRETRDPTATSRNHGMKARFDFRHMTLSLGKKNPKEKNKGGKKKKRK